MHIPGSEKYFVHIYFLHRNVQSFLILMKSYIKFILIRLTTKNPKKANTQFKPTAFPPFIFPTTTTIEKGLFFSFSPVHSVLWPSNFYAVLKLKEQKFEIISIKFNFIQCTYMALFSAAGSYLFQL